MSRYLGAFQDSYPEADYTPNDIGPPEKSHEYHGFASKKEEEDYWDKMADMKEDDLIF